MMLGEKRLGRCKGWFSFHQDVRKAVIAVPANEILQEAKKLHKVSDSLNSLAGQNVSISEALSILSGTVRSSATLLEILVALKLPSKSGFDPAVN
jgi:hypothetical protein